MDASVETDMVATYSSQQVTHLPSFGDLMNASPGIANTRQRELTVFIVPYEKHRIG